MTPKSLFLLCALFALSSTPALAQAPPAGGLRLTAEDPFKGVKNQVSFVLSGGFDMDVIGNVANGALGGRDTTQVAIKQTLPWTDVYTSVPRRAELVVGFGLRQKDEIVVRLSRATYADGLAVDAGNYVDDEGNVVLDLEVSPYKEQSWEIGLRHYMKMTPKVKQYVNLMYGNRIIQPMTMVFRPVDREPGAPLRLYDKSTVKTFGLEMGLTRERGRAGVFLQIGARFVRRMKRNDEDLALWKLEFVNNTGVRFYMPVQFGVLFRL
jgi:hypothetical protein